MKKIFNIIILFVLPFFVFWFYTLVNFLFIDLKNFDTQYSDIKYDKIISQLNIPSNIKYIFVLVDDFKEKSINNWHGKLIEHTLINSLKKQNVKEKIFIIKLNLLQNFNSVSNIGNNDKKMNLYLYIKKLKELYPDFFIGINQSYINHDFLSDLYFTKKISEMNVYSSVAAGNFMNQKDLTFFEQINNIITMFIALNKQAFFYFFMKDYINPKYFHFNLNFFETKKYNPSIKDIGIIYKKDTLKKLDNNILFFAQKIPSYYFLSNAQSTSESTPIGLVYLLIYH